MSTPSVLFRNAIDLNRYSNNVARQVVVNYNRIILDSVDQLQRLIPNVTDGELQPITAPAKAARLRSILAQLKESLATWAAIAPCLLQQNCRAWLSCSLNLLKVSCGKLCQLAHAISLIRLKFRRSSRKRCDD